jgi:hypothetical protein
LASYQGVKAALLALEEFLSRRLPEDLRESSVNARVALLGSADVAKPLTGNMLGIYLHRIVIDPHGRSRHFPPSGMDSNAPRPELPVNLHILLIANGSSAEHEADLLSWAMIELANDGQLDVSRLADTDSEWTERETLTVTPEEMSTEDLMRIWDVFEAKYTSTVPYVIRTVGMKLRAPRTVGPPVVTRVLPTGRP